MKFVVGENGRNPEKNLPRPRLIHHETHMEGPRRELGTPAVGGERLTACATRPPVSGVKDVIHIWDKMKNHEKSNQLMNNVMSLSMIGKVNIQTQLSSDNREAIIKHNEQVDRNRYR